LHILSFFHSLILSFFSPLFISLIMWAAAKAGAEDEGLAFCGAAQAEAATNVFHMVAIYDFTQAEAWAVELEGGKLRCGKGWGWG
jgi:hypothetical protein